MADMIGHPAAGIAAAVRAGEVTASEVVAGHLDRIARLNAELGAFVRVRAAEAAAEAQAVDARADRAELPLAGVPVGVKDCVPVAGERMGYGSAAFPPVPQERDHPVVARLRAAGAVDWYGLSENGALAATVADSALMLWVMAGTTYSAAYSPGEPGRLRIAASVRPPGPGIVIHPSNSAPTRACRARVVLRPLRRADHADAGPSVPARAPVRRAILAAQRRDRADVRSADRVSPWRRHAPAYDPAG